VGGFARRLVKRTLRALGFELRRVRSVVPPAAPVKPPQVYAHLVGLLRSGDVECVIDVGAHEGGFASFLRGAGWEGPIVSFEPVSASFDRLRARAAQDPLWTVHKVALGRVDGTATIRVTGNSDFSSFLEPSSFAVSTWPEASALVAEEIVDVHRLDVKFAEVVAPLIAPRTFLKMDTQGFDLEVFAGASGCLDQVVGIMSELSFQPVYQGMPHFLEALATYEQAGFLVTGFFPISRDRLGRIIENDCVMIRQPLGDGSGGAPTPADPHDDRPR
jgi:FkbM family methyltransferase